MHGSWPRPVKRDSESVTLPQFLQHPSGQAVRSVGFDRFLKRCSAPRLPLRQSLLRPVEDSTE